MLLNVSKIYLCVLIDVRCGPAPFGGISCGSASSADFDPLNTFGLTPTAGFIPPTVIRFLHLDMEAAIAYVYALFLIKASLVAVDATTAVLLLTAEAVAYCKPIWKMKKKLRKSKAAEMRHLDDLTARRHLPSYSHHADKP